MKQQNSKRTTAIIILGTLILVCVMVVGTILTGQSAKHDTDRAVSTVSLMFMDELAGRRKQVVENDLENKIALEKLSKPRISEDFMRFWLCRFRKLDVKQKSHRKMLIDTFINAVFLYDDKLVITFNFKEGTKTITFGDLKEAENKGVGGSDLDSVGAPRNP